MLHFSSKKSVQLCKNNKINQLVYQKLFSSIPTTTNNSNSDPVQTHFRASPHPHPFFPAGKMPVSDRLGDHTGRQQNHIWTEEELNEKMSVLYHHKPKTFMDHVVRTIMRGAYHTFNFITSYDHRDPSVKSIEWRLIALESLAGVPGFVAAGFRHFRSLRTLNRDYGWIPTLLEEAENERMHLMVCIHTFQATPLTRSLVLFLQAFMTPVLMGMYLVHPKSFHRFVGYLEETACDTYLNVIHNVETPGTLLYKGWAEKVAPEMAIGYWRLDKDALWVDTLKCMMADETHHRDVNHTFASMASDDPNPYVLMHKENAAHAWRLELTGEDSRVGTKVDSKKK